MMHYVKINEFKQTQNKNEKIIMKKGEERRRTIFTLLWDGVATVVCLEDFIN
jgi:hypothetical protein